MNYFNRVVVAALLVSTSVSAFSQALKFPQSDVSTIGIAVYDLRTAKLIYEENYGKSMVPASTLKAVTSAAALESLGADFRFQTVVQTTGQIVEGELQGNLIIKASGDPTIASSYFPISADLITSISSELRKKGVTTIAGNIIVDESDFSDAGYNPQWTIGDAGESYAPGLYGFNYADNIFKYKTSTGSSSPEQPQLNVTLTRNDGSLNVVHGVNSYNYIIEGKNLSNPGTMVTLNQNNPAETFKIALINHLKIKGIFVEGSSNASNLFTDTLLVHKSPKLADILSSLMKRSDNMMAEGVLRAIRQGSSRATAIRAEYNVLSQLGVNAAGVRIVDGSGLARLDRVTPRFMTEMLVKMASSKNSSTYLSFFPKVGKEGTVASLLSNSALKGQLALKSGSINGVHCYVGYKLTSDGQPTHTVVIIVNNFFSSRQAVRTAIESFLEHFDWK